MTTLDQRAFDVVGHRVKRVDGPEKVTGSAQFIADISIPGMLYGAVARSPLPHARILNIDTSKAEAMPGVLAVITIEDTPKKRWGVFIKDQPPLAWEKVRYVGEEVAAVVAADLDTARAAASAIEIEYEELPAVFHPEEAMRSGAPLIHDHAEGNVAATIDVERGDVEAAFAKSEFIVEETFQSQAQWHAPIETIGSISQPTPDGRMTVWMNTQTLFMARGRIAGVLDVSEADVRVVAPYVGGGFGGKSCDDNNAMVCALLARKSGRPVKLINTREEEFLAGSRPRPPMKIRVKMGFNREGLVQAKELHMIADNGAYSGKVPGVFNVASLRHDTAYVYPNVKVQSQLVYTNNMPTGAFRGFGNPESAWAVEQAWDIAADELGIDPVELALLNAAEPGYISPHGNRVTSCELKQCIEKSAELMDWRRKHSGKTPYRGVGMGVTVHVSGKRHFGDYDGGSAVIKVDEDGKARIWTGEGEIGQGPLTVLSQIAAEEIGIPIEDVTVSLADTDASTYCHGAYASRLTYIAGNAIREASIEAKKQILETAAELLEAHPADLDIRRGTISVKGAPGAKTVTVREAARSRLYRRGGKPILGFGSFDPDSELQDAERYGNESGAYNFGCQMAEVEIDPETGEVRILNLVSVADCGTVVNPVGAEGQQEGAIAQGVGFALTERFVVEEGRPLNPNFSDYKIPSIQDMPPLKVAFAESYEPTGPFGAKGLGELGLDPTAAAIANAIHNACGVRITEMPITPEKILAELKQRKANSS